ncbi:MAG: leucine-rich repeat domain-containing protein, partial [Oligoflexales bacterium]|nr:leucine-rich repeat domain-containing protein [Oligoflexales bacterium]
LSMSGNVIEDIAALEAGHAPLKRLWLDGNRISSEQLVHLSRFTGLEQLYLGSNLIHSIESLAPLTNLVMLHLSNNYITEIKPISGMASLYELWIDGNCITDFSVLDVMNINTVIGKTSQTPEKCISGL